MKSHLPKGALALIAVVAVVATISSVTFGQTGRDRWVCSWTTAMIGRPPYPPATDAAGGRGQVPAAARLIFPSNQTLRQIVHPTVGGSRVRVVLSNAFGTTSLKIGAAAIAPREKESAIVATSVRTLTFSGGSDVSIPAGAAMVSDAVDLNVAAFADLAIDLFLPDNLDGHTLTVHRGANQTSYLSRPGNFAGARDLEEPTKVASWYFLSDVEVTTADRAPVVVTIGDSITDGTGSTADGNHRWPDVLARRLSAEWHGAMVSVLNAGIAGNRLLSEATPEFGINILARFDRDVLLHPGVTHIVLLEGINDIGMARNAPAPAAAELIAAQKQIIERAHTRGFKVIGATLTPFEGATYYTETGEAKRQAVNEWIRHGNAFDGVIDFDAAVRDPQQPKHFAAAYDRGDHLHLNDAGYEAMANAVDLGLFK